MAGNYGSTLRNDSNYDFDMFDTRPKSVPVKQTKREPLSLKIIRPVQKSAEQLEAESKAQRVFAVKALTICVAVALMAFSLIFSQVRLGVAINEGQALQDKLSDAQQAGIGLESKLNQKLASYDIDSYAIEKLGMVKLKGNQIKYFVYNDDNEVVYTN